MCEHIRLGGESLCRVVWQAAERGNPTARVLWAGTDQKIDVFGLPVKPVYRDCVAAHQRILDLRLVKTLG